MEKLFSFIMGFFMEASIYLMCHACNLCSTGHYKGVPLAILANMELKDGKLAGLEKTNKTKLLRRVKQ